MKPRPKSLVDKVADFQNVIETENPCEVMKVQVSLWILWDTIRNQVKECERYRTEEQCLGVNRDIGSAAQPVSLGSLLEGFKEDDKWTYRNSDPQKRGICRNWHTEPDTEANADFDRFYMESVTGGN